MASTALMTVTLARVAGVLEIVACTPADKNGQVNPFLLYALDLAGTNEIYKIGGIQAIGAMAYGTDGALAALGLVIMEDPKGIQPIYAPAPIIRADTLARHPKIKDVLAPVFRSLDTPTLQSLNAKVALEGQDAKQVSSAYLKSRGFIK